MTLGTTAGAAENDVGFGEGRQDDVGKDEGDEVGIGVRYGKGEVGAGVAVRTMTPYVKKINEIWSVSQ